jgi:hypothetical protein
MLLSEYSGGGGKLYKPKLNTMRKILLFLLLTTSIASTSCEKSDSGDRRCAAITQDGDRCKRKAADDSIYCWQHKK